MKFYKIQDKNTGLYSTGGIYPRLSKNGKVWDKLIHVKKHLDLFKSGNEYIFPETYKNAEIVEFEVKISEKTDLNDFLKK